MREARSGRGPDIWLAGDPADLGQWLERGAAGIVTNTVVQRELAAKYGGLLEVTRRYLDITDKPVVIEVEGHTTEELLEVSHVFTALSPQIAIKIPCIAHGLGAFRALAKEGVTTFCTTVFSLAQAAAVGAGRRHSRAAVLRAGQGTGRRSGQAGARVHGHVRPVGAAAVRDRGAGALGGDGDRGAGRRRRRHHRVLADLPCHAGASPDRTWNDTFAGQWRQMLEAGQLRGVVQPGS